MGERAGSSLINNLANLLMEQGGEKEAEHLYREALGGRRRVLGNEHPSTLVSINNLGSLLQAQGKLADAEALCREALAGQRRVLGNEHPNTLSVIGNLGTLLQKLGQLDAAECVLRACQVHVAGGDTAAALRAWERAVAIQERHAGRSDMRSVSLITSE